MATLWKRTPTERKSLKNWKDYIIEDAIIVSEKAGKAVKPQTISFCWRKLCLHIVHGFRGLTTEPSREIEK